MATQYSSLPRMGRMQRGKEKRHSQPCDTNNIRKLSAFPGNDVHLHTDSAFSLKPPPLFLFNSPNLKTKNKKKTPKIAKLDMTEKKTQQMWFKLCSLFLPQSMLFPLGLFTTCCAWQSSQAGTGKFPFPATLSHHLHLWSHPALPTSFLTKHSSFW